MIHQVIQTLRSTLELLIINLLFFYDFLMFFHNNILFITTYLLLLFKFILSERLSNSLLGWDVLLFAEFINIVSIL